MLVNFAPRGVVVKHDTKPSGSIQEQLNNIDDKLDRIEQLVMKFWDVPDSGYNEIQVEESSSVEK